MTAAKTEKTKNKKRKRAEIESKDIAETSEEAITADVVFEDGAAEDIKEEDVTEAAEASEQEEDDKVEPEVEDEVSAKALNTFERAKDVEFDGKLVASIRRLLQLSSSTLVQMRFSLNGKTCRFILCSRRVCINSALRSPPKFKSRLSLWQ